MTRYEFKNRNLAESFADNCHKLHGIVLGDNGKFWVVRMADFKKLINSGYSAA